MHSLDDVHSFNDGSGIVPELHDVWSNLRTQISVFAPQFDDFGSLVGSRSVWSSGSRAIASGSTCASPFHSHADSSDTGNQPPVDEHLVCAWDRGEAHHICVVGDGQDQGLGLSPHWVMWQRVNNHIVSTRIDLAPVLDALAQLNDHRAPLARATTRRARAVERERISRELHDIAVQQLYATRLRLSALSISTYAPITEQLTSIGEAIDDVITAIRQEILANGGLETSLAFAQLDAIASSILTPYGCAHDLIVDTEIDARLLVHARAVVTEAVSNAARHGMASTVWIRVSQVDGRLRLTIADNGAGYGAPDPEKKPASGNGIKNMTARASLCGGTCRLSPRRRGGTVVIWEAPTRGGMS